MNYLPHTPHLVGGSGKSAFRFNEALCTELLAQLQNHLIPSVRQAQFGCINGRRAAIYIADHGSNAHTLWLEEDDVRDWFIARYLSDLQQMQEIELEILSALDTQLTEQRINDSQKYHATVMPIV